MGCINIEYPLAGGKVCSGRNGAFAIVFLGLCFMLNSGDSLLAERPDLAGASARGEILDAGDLLGSF